MMIDNNREFIDSREGFTMEEETAYFAMQSIDRGQTLLEWMEELWKDWEGLTPPQYFTITHSGKGGHTAIAIGTLAQARRIEARGRTIIAIEHMAGYTPIVETRDEHCDSEARYAKE